MPLRTSCVWAHDHSVLVVKVLPDISQRTWLGVEVIDRHVKETLDLAGVEVHRDDVVAARRLYHVGDELRRYGRPRFVLLVLPRVREVW